jgi:hypothetical protein
MTTFVLVWVLVISAGGKPTVFGPPVEDLASCVRMQQAVKYQEATCVQVKLLAK